MPEEIEKGGRNDRLTVEELSDILVLDEASTVDGSSRLGNVLDVYRKRRERRRGTISVSRPKGRRRKKG